MAFEQTKPASTTYFDAASTEPLHPAARDALLAAYDSGWADPARLYRSGRQARLILDSAREAIAGVIGARPDEVVFTANGTQAVHHAVVGTAAARRRTGSRVVISAVEHSSAFHAARAVPDVDLRTVGVDSTGLVDTGAFAAELSDDTAVACLQSANHEVGTVQPVAGVAEACGELGVPLVVDAAQSVGRDDLPTGWQVLTASAHKWGGPPGIGVLAIRRGTRWRSPMPEDERGDGRVPGFENVPAAVAAAAALQARLDERQALTSAHREMVDRIRRRVPELVPDVEVVGHPTRRLPHLVTFSCLYVNGEALVTELDKEGFAVSSGSSCTASTLQPSHVLEAMGVLTHGNVRVSLTRTATDADVDRFLEILPGVVSRLRDAAGAEGL